MQYRKFYSELAKLLYAVAYVDGHISDKEKQALRELVRQELVPAETHTDSFGTDAAYYTEIEFDILDDTRPDPQAAFESFLRYVEQHHTAIDGRMRHLSLALAQKIAQVYHKTSRKEERLLRLLKKQLAVVS